MKTKNILIIIIVLFSFLSMLSAQDSIEDLKSLLAEIKTYEYGQSRENLTAFNVLLSEIGNSNEKQLQAEKEMIDFLESDATLPAKQFICEALSIYGSNESVSVLEDMLSESETEDMALFALERISVEEASEVLLDALSDADGKLKPGIINALGNRQVEEAVEEISPLIGDPNNELAYAAIAALGKIGGDEAAGALAKALSDPKLKLKAEVIQAYLRCAIVYEDNNNNKNALNIYQSLNKSEFDPQVRKAALKGIIRTSGQKATDVIVSFLDNENPENFSIVIPLVQDIPKSEDVSPIIEKMSKLQPEDQIILLGALAGRKEPVVVKAMVKLTKSNDQQIRLAALDALSLSGDAETAILFASVAAGTKGMDRAMARQGLDRLNASGTDKLIVNTIPVSDDPRKIELIRSTSTRYISSASSLLIIELKNSNSQVRIASIKALKNIGSPDELNAMLDYHMKTSDNAEIKELENTIVSISKRIPESQSQAGFLLSKYDKLDKDVTKSSYLEMMGRIGDPKSLVVLKTALEGKNPELQTSAIRGYSNWPNAKPADELLNIAKSSKNQTHRTLALRGYLNLLNRDTEIDDNKKLGMYKEAMNLATQTSEKRLVLSGLGDVNTPDSFNFVASYLDDQDVKGEAEIAVLKIAFELGADHIELTLPVVKKVNNATQNEDIKEQSGYLIKYAEDGFEDD